MGVKTGEPTEMAFEAAMARLEQIVRQLEDGGRTLDESLLLFEEGIKLTRECSRQLAEAQGRLDLLVKMSNGPTEARPHEL